MTDAAAAPIGPAVLPLGEDEAWSRPMIERQLEVLAELAELGLEMARAVAREASGETPELVFHGDIAMAFARVSRAARMAVLLQSKLIQDLKTGGRKAAPPEDAEIEPRSLQVLWLDDDDNYVPAPPIPDSWGKWNEWDALQAERTEGEACERPNRDDIHADLRPKAEIVSAICEDLGLDAERTREVLAAFAEEGIESGVAGSPFSPCEECRAHSSGIARLGVPGRRGPGRGQRRLRERRRGRDPAGGQAEGQAAQAQAGRLT